MIRASHLQTAARVLLLLGLLNASTTEGQVLTGTVVEAEGNRLMPAVELRLIEHGNTVGAALTDSTGVFRLRAPYPGQFSLWASALGYDSVFISGIELEPGQEVQVEVRLGSRPVELAPLEVLARRHRGRGMMKDYYYRLDQNRKTGRGIVLDRDQLEEVEGFATADVLGRQPRMAFRRNSNNVKELYVRRHGRYCRPKYYLNGIKADAGVLQMPVSILEGIEIYRGADNLEFDNNCAVVIAWTRQDWTPPEPRDDFLSRSLWASFGATAGILVLALITFR